MAEASSDGDFNMKASLPTLSQPTGEFQELAQRKGEGKASEGRRQGHHGPIPNSLRTQTAPGKESDLWAWILGPQRR